jgi:hypothetical protein
VFVPGRAFWPGVIFEGIARNLPHSTVPEKGFDLVGSGLTYNIRLDL